MEPNYGKPTGQETYRNESDVSRSLEGFLSVLEDIRIFLADNSQQIGYDKCAGMLKKLDDAEKELKGAINFYEQKANTEAPGIGTYDGIKTNQRGKPSALGKAFMVLKSLISRD